MSKDVIYRQDAIDTTHRKIFQEIVVEYPSYTIYPEYKGKPYFSIKYTENGQEFIGYGTYKPEVLSEFLKEYFMPFEQPEPQWIPCSDSKGLPDGRLNKSYLVQDKDGKLAVGTYTNWGWVFGHYMNDPVAWMPLPEPYKGEGNETNNYFCCRRRKRRKGDNHKR